MSASAEMTGGQSPETIEKLAEPLTTCAPADPTESMPLGRTDDRREAVQTEPESSSCWITVF